MKPRADAEIAFFQAAGPTGKTYAISCAVGTIAYADFVPGWYDCWAPSGAAGEHFRWKYLDSLTATALPGDLDFPVAGTSGQAAGEVNGMAPANTSIRLYIDSVQRLAILYSAAGPVTLYCVQVL